MPITPDTKNWTWVIERPCPECGFDASSFEPRDVPAMIRANAARWPAVLARPDVRERPDDSTWSALEYSAHVRDVYRVFLTRIHRMLTEDDPLFDNWDQDATAVAERYNEQDPAAVSVELVTAADRLATSIDAVGEGQWGRTGRRGDGTDFTVSSICVYLIHDPVHHLWDVRG